MSDVLVVYPALFLQVRAGPVCCAQNRVSPPEVSLFLLFAPGVSEATDVAVQCAEQQQQGSSTLKLIPSRSNLSEAASNHRHAGSCGQPSSLAEPAPACPSPSGPPTLRSTSTSLVHCEFASDATNNLGYGVQEHLHKMPAHGRSACCPSCRPACCKSPYFCIFRRCTIFEATPDS